MREVTTNCGSFWLKLALVLALSVVVSPTRKRLPMPVDTSLPAKGEEHVGSGPVVRRLAFDLEAPTRAGTELEKL